MRKMIRSPWSPLRAMRTAALGFALVAMGCEGDPGPQGPQGPQGEQGTPGNSATVDPALNTMDKAFAGIGGKAAIQNLQGFAMETAGRRWAPGEGYRPEDLLLGSTYDGTQVRYDVKGDRLSINHKRTLNIFNANAPQNYTEIIRGNLGFLDGSESLFGAPGGNLLADRTAAIRRQQRLLNPHLILKDVAANASIAKDGGPAVLDGSLHQLLVVNDPVYPLSLYVNSQTGRISKLVTLENDHLHRDIPIEVFYSGWEVTGSGTPLFPKQVYISVNGHLLHEETRKSVTVNGTLADTLFAFPAAASPVFNEADAKRGEANHQFHMTFASFGIPLDGLQTAVVPTELSPGVWFVGGSSHNTLAIEQANGVVIVEAPLYPERSKAIIDWIKAEPKFEGKPITHVLATHHHDDHTAGIRAFVAEGAKLLVHESTAAHFRQILRNPSTIAPDPLSAKPSAALTVMTVPAGGNVVLADATNPVHAYPLETVHAADALLFYVPAAGNRLAFSSDLYNPGNGGSAIGNGAKELHKSITQTHNLAVDTVAGGHGAHAPLSELAALANR